MKLFYKEFGEGMPIIILHGLFGSSDNWLSIAKELAKTYKVYLLDMRNHGSSPHDKEFNYQVMASDLKKFIEDHKLLHPIIIGHSMGGKTVMEYAKDNLSNYKLIIVDIAPRFYKRHHDQILEGLNHIDLNNLKSRQQADEQLSYYESNPGIRQFLLKNLFRNSENEFAWKFNLGVITEKINNIGEALEENIRIDNPALFIKGAKSNYINAKDEVMIRSIFTNVKMETISGSGHWVHAENPVDFLGVVRKFIET